MRSPSCPSSASKAKLWERSLQSGCPTFTPCQVFARLSEQLVQAHALALMLHVSQEPPRVEQGYEPVQVRMLLDQRPVEPTDLAVLAVGIVVAQLREPLGSSAFGGHPIRCVSELDVRSEEWMVG